ncbi:MAG: hypothetical protein J6V44_17635 [Methanobrevibacter sp.]|nr:hypothetical protein [Methanobrevibacter sp.]
MTLTSFLRICEGYGLRVKKDIFYQAMSGDYCICDFSSRGQKAFLYTDKGVIATTKEESLREYLDDKMLELKRRILRKKLWRMESDFD